MLKNIEQNREVELQGEQCLKLRLEKIVVR